MQTRFSYKHQDKIANGFLNGPANPGRNRATPYCTYPFIFWGFFASEILKSKRLGRNPFIPTLSAPTRHSSMARTLERFVSRLHIGDAVRFSRDRDAHVAIYIGRAKVIHLTSSSSRFVRIDSLHDVQVTSAALPEFYSTELDERMRDDHDVTPFDGQEVVNRAMKKLGEQEFDSSEHFVTWARYGVGVSLQARSHRRSDATYALAGVVLGAIAVGVAGLVVGGVFSWLKGDASDDDDAASGSSSGDHGGSSSASRQAQPARLPGGRDRRCATHSPQSEEFVQRRHSVLVTRLVEDELQCG